MIAVHDLLNHEGNPKTVREWEFADDLDALYIEDAERVSSEQYYRLYRVDGRDLTRLFQKYHDLPCTRTQAIVQFYRYIWRFS